MHFKMQNAVQPVTKVEEKVVEKAEGTAENKATVHENLDPVKLMNRNEVAKVQK